MSSVAHKALRPIALFEAFKGTIILVAGFGLLGFMGRDNEAFAEELIRHLHLNPAHHYPHIFITAMAQQDDSRILMLAGFAGLYAAMRFAEAYGLWHERRWAEWLAALSSGVYVPIEVYELAYRANWFKFGTLVLNLVILAYMVWLLTENRRRRAAQATKA